MSSSQTPVIFNFNPMSPKSEHNKVWKGRIYGYSFVVVLHLKELTDCSLIFNTAVCFTRFKHLNLKGSGHRFNVFNNQVQISQQRPGAPSTGRLLNLQTGSTKKKKKRKKKLQYFPVFPLCCTNNDIFTRDPWKAWIYDSHLAEIVKEKTVMVIF